MAWGVAADLTNPEVQAYQAKLMYDLVPVGGHESEAFNVTPGEASPHLRRFIVDMYSWTTVLAQFSRYLPQQLFPFYGQARRGGRPSGVRERWRLVW